MGEMFGLGLALEVEGRPMGSQLGFGGRQARREVESVGRWFDDV